ncbi:hypothetical protein [Moraxella cuniculi]|uniref:hypothetical protein n=1 Tax=Moraxella cuniculi TaxID=34061 RepID=UPI001D0CFB40|nr:hypothetical protein [Moraxella cuniculi]
MSTNNQPVIQSSSNTLIRRVATKILVLSLCIMSFVAGFLAHQSRQMNYCKSLNQEPVGQDGVIVCQPSQSAKVSP